ncbi:hypothetical protein QQG55_21000 [Brugia pahangi]
MHALNSLATNDGAAKVRQFNEHLMDYWHNLISKQRHQIYFSHLCLAYNKEVRVIKNKDLSYAWTPVLAEPEKSVWTDTDRMTDLYLPFSQVKP